MIHAFFAVYLFGIAVLAFPDLIVLFRMKEEKKEAAVQKSFREEGPLWTRFLSYRPLRRESEKCGILGVWRASRVLSAALFVSLFVLCLSFGKIFLSLILPFFGYVVPLLFFSLYLKRRQGRLLSDLEISLSLITSSYLRENLFSRAVKENLPFLPLMIRRPMEAYLKDEETSSGERGPVLRLRSAFPDETMEVWCDAVLQSFEDRSMKSALLTVLSSLSARRTALTRSGEKRRGAVIEFLTMAAMDLGSLILIPALDSSWGSFLYDSFPGQMVLCAVFLALFATTSAALSKLNKRREETA